MNLRQFTSIALAIALIAACGKIFQPLTEKERNTVSKLTSDLKPRCVGRYLIDMPGDALSAGYVVVEGVTVETKRMSSDEFTREMGAREASLKAKKNRYGYRVLYDYGHVTNAPYSRYFITLADLDDTADLSRAIEAYKWDAGYQFKLRIEASDWINSEYKVKVHNTPYAVPDLKLNDVPEKTHLVLNLAARVRGRPDDEIPTEPGLCFKDGFLPRKAATGEEVGILFALKDRPDVYFQMETDTDIRGLKKDAIPNRLSQIKIDVKDIDGRIIRSAPVTVGGIGADELLISATTEAKIPGHFFKIEANTTLGGAATPFLVLEMKNGGLNGFTADHLETASLTENEAIAVWDVISRTLRPRPNGF
ncbi:Tle cognate immunity protein 4 C-terminal domain-containing protein [Paraburkholderia sacchari]|uniref:T6SS immunity protein Tli4 family protein n=1 Tax=Paraburkholderia sacchari TaxID=159450 RepID=UPI0039A5005A